MPQEPRSPSPLSGEGSPKNPSPEPEHSSEDEEAKSPGGTSADVGAGRSPDAIPEPQTRDLVQINLLAMAWIWGLLPGALTGGVVTYYLWAAVPSLKNFLSLVGLDMSDMPPSSDFKAVESIVRLSVEYGLPAIVRFNVLRAAWHPKKILNMEIDKDYTDWLESNPDVQLYVEYLAEYNSSLDSTLIKRIIEAEFTVLLFIKTLPPREGANSSEFKTSVGGLDTYTQQVVAKGEWARLIGKYTDNAYGPSDVVLVQQNTTELVKLLAGGGMVAYDARLLLSWCMLHRLLPLVAGRVTVQSPNLVEKDCFRAVFGVMEMALMNSYLRYSVPRTVVEKVTEMSHNLMRALTKKIADTAWIQGAMRRVSLEKASGMRLLIAYPWDVANTTLTEAFFGDCPETFLLLLLNHSTGSFTIHSFNQQTSAKVFAC
ncbi:uncharacterized protein LOC144095337 [Amblyomma americanum]